MLENQLNSKVDWECGIGANPWRKQRFTETEMLRKFYLGKEDASVESELRASHMESETIKVWNQDYSSHLIVISHLLVSGMPHEGHSMTISDFEGP